LRAAYLAKNYTRQTARALYGLDALAAVDPDGDNPAVRAFVETAGGEILQSLVSEGFAIIRHGETAVADHPNGRGSPETRGSAKG
jgi:hypothetical protein